MNDVTVYSAVPFEKLYKFLEADENNMAICPSCEERKLKLRNFGYARFSCERQCDRDRVVELIDLLGFEIDRTGMCKFTDLFAEIRKHK